MKKHKNKCRCVKVLFVLCEAAFLAKPAIRSNVLARAPRIPLLSGLVGCKNHASKTWPEGTDPFLARHCEEPQATGQSTILAPLVIASAAKQSSPLAEVEKK